MVNLTRYRVVPILNWLVALKLRRVESGPPPPVLIGLTRRTRLAYAASLRRL